MNFKSTAWILGLVFLFVFKDSSVLAFTSCQSYCQCSKNKKIIVCKLPSNFHSQLQCSVIWKHLRISIETDQVSNESQISLPDNIFPVCDKVDHLTLLPKHPISVLSADSLKGLSELQSFTSEPGGALATLGPKLLQWTPELNTIKIYKNRLSRLSNAVLSDCAKLTTLDLSRNLIESIDDKALANCDKLRYLRLGGNRLKSLSRATFNGLSNLQQLSLNDNQLQTLEPVTFSSTVRLRRLDLSGNKLTQIDNKMLLKLSSLVHLNLKNNKLFYLETYSLNDLVSLEELNLANNFEIRSLKWNLFAANTQLKKLTLNGSVTCVVEASSRPPSHAVISAFAVYNLCTGTRPMRIPTTLRPRIPIIKLGRKRPTDKRKLPEYPLNDEEIAQISEPQTRIVYRIPVWLVGLVCGLAVGFLVTFGLLMSCCTLQAKRINRLKRQRQAASLPYYPPPSTCLPAKSVEYSNTRRSMMGSGPASLGCPSAGYFSTFNASRPSSSLYQAGCHHSPPLPSITREDDDVSYQMTMSTEI